MTTTHKTLLDNYGLLLNFDQLAKILQRKPDGLRMSLQSPSSAWAREISAARVRIGRRVLFDTASVAKVIDQCRETRGRSD
jgi:hypothetical protein